MSRPCFVHYREADGPLCARVGRSRMTDMKAARQHWQSVGGVSDRISAKAGKQIARDVTNCRSVKGATG